MEDVKQRFWNKVIKGPGCWEWIGARMQRQDCSGKSYGIFCWSHDRKVLAHRAAWLLAGREIPNGLIILHKCDNPSCVRLAHLYAGTPADNVHDALSRGRWAVGEQAGKWKYTRETVIQVKALWPLFTTRVISNMLHVSRTHVQAIGSGKSRMYER